MTHDELLALLNSKSDSDEIHALRAVVELHKPEHSQSGYRCIVCFIDTTYPCATIQTIIKELS